MNILALTSEMGKNMEFGFIHLFCRISYFKQDSKDKYCFADFFFHTAFMTEKRSLCN